jgi:Raf kinase inhibitor-like YbhB/YbcL family protein
MFRFDPYAELSTLKTVGSFQLTSTDLAHGQPLARAQWGKAGGGSDTSPQLSWSGFPKETKSFAVTCYDPDAPTGSGYWHWAVFNVPAHVTALEAGAGNLGSAALPPGAVMLPNEARLPGYIGAGPPPGTGVHRYFFVVHAVDAATLDIDPQSTPAVLGFHLHFHTLARAILMGTGEG